MAVHNFSDTYQKRRGKCVKIANGFSIDKKQHESDTLRLANRTSWMKCFIIQKTEGSIGKCASPLVLAGRFLIPVLIKLRQLN